ncbi:MAG: hypothetical protein IT184_10360 [Acidobacteria bacterium]|nr:hypothetical protein [Acidobacteriota bacterium]
MTRASGASPEGLAASRFALAPAAAVWLDYIARSTAEDAVAVYEQGKAILDRGALDVPPAYSNEDWRGIDGLCYTPFGIGQTLFDVPFIWLGPRREPDGAAGVRRRRHAAESLRRRRQHRAGCHRRRLRVYPRASAVRARREQSRRGTPSSCCRPRCGTSPDARRFRPFPPRRRPAARSATGCLSVDFWWLYLVYLRALPIAAAALIATALLAAALAILRRLSTRARIADERAPAQNP